MYHPAGVGFLRVADYRRQTLLAWFRDFLLRQGRFFCREIQLSWSWLWEPDYRWQLSWSRLSELDYCRQSGSHLLQEPDDLWQVSGHEFWDQSWGSIFFGSWGYCRRQSSWSQFTQEPVCREPTWRPPRGTDHSGQDQMPFAHTVRVNDGANTTDKGSSGAQYCWGQGYGMHGSSRHGAGGFHGNAHYRRYGSQSTQLIGPSQPPIQQPVTLQCQLIMEIRRCPLFPSWLWWVCIIHPAWWCPLPAWMCSTDHQTWQLRWEPATCNSKCRTSIGSNHHISVHWTRRCCFPDHSWSSSPQLLLVHWASRPRMLSPWRKPCGRWWIPFCDNSNVWFILAMDLEHPRHLFTRMQAHP